MLSLTTCTLANGFVPTSFVEDDHAFMHVHLRGGKAYAVGRIHGLEHVVDEAADACVDLPHRLGDDVQAGVGVAQDLELGHE